MKMTLENIINQSITVISGGAEGYKGQHICPMKDVLFSMAQRCSDRINTARHILKTKGVDQYKQYKTRIPCWFPSGCIAYHDAKDENMVSHTNVIVLDIDHLSESEMNEFRIDFFNKPYVIAVLKSLSGTGLYALVFVEDWHHTKGYYRYFGNLLKHLYNIDLDMNATNVARKRFISWEEDINKWIKPLDTNIEPWKLYLNDTKLIQSTESPYQPMMKYPRDSNKDMERTHKAMWKLLENGFNADNYGYWFHIGCDFAAFDDGELMFEKLCNNYSVGQDMKTKRATWIKCKEHPSPIDEDLHRKWQGMAKNRLGCNWDNETIEFDFNTDQPPV